MLGSVFAASTQGAPEKLQVASRYEHSITQNVRRLNYGAITPEK